MIGRFLKIFSSASHNRLQLAPLLRTYPTGDEEDGGDQRRLPHPTLRRRLRGVAHHQRQVRVPPGRQPRKTRGQAQGPVHPRVHRGVLRGGQGSRAVNVNVTFRRRCGVLDIDMVMDMVTVMGHGHEHGDGHLGRAFRPKILT